MDNEVVGTLNRTLQSEILLLKRRLAEEGRLVASKGFGSDAELARVWELRALEEYYKKGMKGVARVKKHGTRVWRKVGVISFLNDYLRLHCQDVKTGEILMIDLSEWDIEDIPVAKRLRVAEDTIRVITAKAEEARNEMQCLSEEILTTFEDFKRKLEPLMRRQRRLRKKQDLVERLADEAVRAVRTAQSEHAKALERMCDERMCDEGERRSDGDS